MTLNEIFFDLCMVTCSFNRCGFFGCLSILRLTSSSGDQSRPMPHPFQHEQLLLSSSSCYLSIHSRWVICRYCVTTHNTLTAEPQFNCFLSVIPWYQCRKHSHHLLSSFSASQKVSIATMLWASIECWLQYAKWWHQRRITESDTSMVDKWIAK